jgi:hypothetical protein
MHGHQGPQDNNLALLNPHPHLINIHNQDIVFMVGDVADNLLFLLFER